MKAVRKKKEFKRKLKCEICSEEITVVDKNLLSIIREAWEWEHEECYDMKFILGMKILFRGGERAWIY